MLLMIDNYDSFTWNIVQYLQELSYQVNVVKNDEISISDIKYISPSHIIISPGPCTPDQAGISMQIIHQLKSNIPILGICLGHQSIGQVFGAKIVRANEVMHGKTSLIYHNKKGVFANLSNPFTATRYHSLIIAYETIPKCLEVTAWTQHLNGTIDKIMGIQHKKYAIEGVQFHPESILTEHGHKILSNFMKNH